ncbi:MAG: FAD-dependent oxidoreductase [Kiritimatiellae bacterium]|nr:FAD-dependent oxidoreductase [Kiritimatiellia bacterium]
MPARIIILGGGISGLCAGQRLAAAGAEVVVLEAQAFCGGLAATVHQDGCHLDFGPHLFFSDDAEVLAHVRRGLFDEPLPAASRRVRFCYEGRFLDYPLTTSGVLLQMGAAAGLAATVSFLKSRLGRRRHGAADAGQTVRDWAVANFGAHLYRTFFKPYTEQFWGVPCDELSSRCIPTHTRLSFSRTLALMLRRRRAARTGSLIERERLPVYYPPNGFGAIAERVAADFTGAGGRLLLNCRVVELAVEPGARVRVTYERAGSRETVEGSGVVSTLPLSTLISILRPVPPRPVLASASKLEYRPLLVLALVTRRQQVLGGHYVYVLNRPYNRLSELNAFSAATSPAGENMIALEIPCRPGDAAWTATADELVERCSGALEQDGILTRADIDRARVVKTPHAYPVYRKDYAEHLARVREFLRPIEPLELLGRTGEFMYLDTDQCIRRAWERAEKVRAKRL